MGIYIKSYSAISPVGINQVNKEADALSEKSEYLKCAEPDYKEVINPGLLRRMSRVVKMGVYSGLEALKKANIENPDAIITGTGLGCIEDTENFLVSIIKNNEQFLAPTAFIQSTHNTIGAQIALILKCNNYNFTYVNRNNSFEDALTDANMLLNDQEVGNVLVGGVDELTENSFRIMKRLGLYKSMNDIGIAGSVGSIAGEGAVFFVLDNKIENSVCEIKSVKTYNNLEKQTISEKIIVDFLTANKLQIGDIDVFITGINGDPANDNIYEKAVDLFYEKATVCIYKNICGEYFTSSSYALMISADIIKHQIIPEEIKINDVIKSKIRNVLIYNQFRNKNHSLILIKEC